MEEQIMVSVLCTAYNQEKYIRECLDGFVMQKTTFQFEVLINDDASTDGTAAIIKEYQEAYPKIIFPIYQDENQYSKGVSITGEVLFPLARGKYIAICEGDDWWTDSYKLQRQYEEMENLPQCSASFHRVACSYEDGSATGEYMPSERLISAIYSSEQIVKKIMENDFFHTSSVFVRSTVYRDMVDIVPAFRKATSVGDVTMMLFFATKGSIFFIDTPMSCYRKNSDGSWTVRTMRQDKAKKIDHFNQIITMINLFDEYTDYHFHDFCYMGVWKRKLSIARASDNRSCYKELMKGDNLAIFMGQSMRTKISIFCAAFCPALLKIYRSVAK